MMSVLRSLGVRVLFHVEEVCGRSSSALALLLECISLATPLLLDGLDVPS